MQTLLAKGFLPMTYQISKIRGDELRYADVMPFPKIAREQGKCYCPSKRFGQEVLHMKCEYGKE